MITPIVLLYTVCGLSLVRISEALCGSSIRWSHNLNIEHVYGIWYGVGYTKHAPDINDKPEVFGCVTLHISDADEIYHDWTNPRSNYPYERWLSHQNNPWTDTPQLSGSWIDTYNRYKRRAKNFSSTGSQTFQTFGRYKRYIYGDKKLNVIWEEDGRRMQQTYIYMKDDPGLWTVEKWQPMERDMMSYGLDVWNRDDQTHTRDSKVIRVLKVTVDLLIINHCADSGGGIYSLILRRSPNRVGYWEWYELQKQLYSFDLPRVYKKAPVCLACLTTISWPVLLIFVAVLTFS